MNYRKQGGYFQYKEDPSVKNAQSVGKIFHEVSLLLKFLQTKPQVKSVSISFYNFFYTVVRNLVDKEDEKYDISDDLIEAFYPI